MDIKATKDTETGLVSTVYKLQLGEMVARHIHTFEHSTECTTGESEVEIENVKTFRMFPGDPPYMLPANIYHEIRAVVDNTTVINISPFGHHVSNRPKYVNRVRLVDGTIVEVKSKYELC